MTDAIEALNEVERWIVYGETKNISPANALDIIRTTLKEREWQDIETCPNDVDVLIAHDDKTVKSIYAEDNDYTWEKYKGKKWPYVSPTHWMPLPEPPKEKGDR